MDSTTADTDTVPPAIKLSDVPFDISFHPEMDIVAVGLVSGLVHLYQYSTEGCKEVLKVSYHKEACRTVDFSADGKFLYTASADKSVRCVTSEGKVAWQATNNHAAGVNALMSVDNTSLFSGDDEGFVKIWDTRTKRPIFEFDTHEDVITSFVINEARDTAVATSADGTLSAYNLKKGKLIARSDQLEDELLSCAIIKHGKKLVCGTQSGVLNLYTWGHWVDLDDRAVGHPPSIDSMVVVDEDTIITGSEDGLIRVVQVQPTKFHGILGEHGEYPIERIEYSRDHRFLGSCSHDAYVKFCDIAFLFEDDDEDDEEGMDTSEAGAGSGEAEAGAGVGAGAGAPADVASRMKVKEAADSFFSDL